MSWSVCENADDFLKKRGSVLVADESKHNLAWRAIRRAREASPDQIQDIFLTFDGGSSSVAHAFSENTQQHIVLSAMSEAIVQDLTTTLQAQDIHPKVVEGPRETAHTFVQWWSELTGCSHEVEMNQGLYELTRVKMPDPNGGQMVNATAEHQDTLEAFVMGFWRDCFPHRRITEEIIRARVQRFVDEKHAFLWQNQDGALVSMAAIVRESPNTTSISGVYTPPGERGKGHAARIVAALSQERLDSGKKACNLHTDLDNDTSNGVYIRIGYELIGKSARIRLNSSDETRPCGH